MPKLRLTVPAIDHLPLPARGQVEYYDTHLPAFGLRVSYSGAKAWFVMTRVDRKLTRLTLGRYPALSLVSPVTRHEPSSTMPAPEAIPGTWKLRRAQGEGPGEHFESVATLFMAQYAERGLRPNTVREYRRVLQGADTKHWRSRPIRSLTRSDVVDMLTKIEQRGASAASNRSLAYLSKFFNWCLSEFCQLVRQPGFARSRERHRAIGLSTTKN